ncbi:MAG: lipoprotein ABC transporter ATP-binding protein LolD [bacterium]|nr:MAG: lipoprotein ABC transporter ATP-binding protein LolD [bacterium]
MVKLKNVYKSYMRGGKKEEILRNCSLTIEKGEFLVIMGPSGSGKSTLLNLVGAIDQADSGEIIVNDNNINAMDDNQLTLFRREHIGIIFQFFNLLPSLSALENIALPLLLAGMAYHKSMTQAQEYINLVELDQKMANKPEELSGGEMQRVAIARALITQPSVLLADEPTGNLDTRNTNIIVSLLTELSQKSKYTILFVTHNEEIAKIGDRVVHLKDGILNP